MKPSISIDERGVLLHVTDAEGKGVSVALNAETLAELSAQVVIARERLKSPGAGWALVRAITAMARELTKPEETKADGPPDPDPARAQNSK